MKLEFYQWLCLFSVPALIQSIFKWARNTIKGKSHTEETLQLGLQALLRSQMINDYNRWLEKGYAPIYARESFENCWQQYHKLGANGVMNDIRDKFMALPTKTAQTSGTDK